MHMQTRHYTLLYAHALSFCSYTEQNLSHNNVKNALTEPQRRFSYCLVSLVASKSIFVIVSAHLVSVGVEEQKVEGDGSDDVDNEPAFEVVNGDFARMRHHFIVLVHVRGAKVDDYVDDEHDVHDKVYHLQGVAVFHCRLCFLRKALLKFSTRSSINMVEIILRHRS